MSRHLSDHSPSRCPHAARRFYRVPVKSCRGFHVGAFCTDCGQSVNGPGHWVPRRQVPQDLATLPLLRAPVARPRQGELFPEEEGGQS
jgi:hypothetical protein